MKRHHVHRLEGTDLAGPDDAPHRLDWRVERTGVSGEQFDAVLLSRLDHESRLVQRQRHRFLNDHVLAVLGSEHRVRAMEMVRGRYPDHVDIGVLAQLFDALICPPSEVSQEGLAGLWAHVGHGHDFDVGLVAHHVKHSPTRVADADNTEPQGRSVVRGRAGRGHDGASVTW